MVGLFVKITRAGNQTRPQYNNNMKVEIERLNGLTVINLEKIRSAKYDHNVEINGEHSNTCFICGKPTGSRTFVHYITDGFLIPADLDHDDLEYFDMQSQGCFPIGSECAKKIGSEFLMKL